jgi:TRAP-type C4-dicarboxylate transport system substrate-binding protein
MRRRGARLAAAALWAAAGSAWAQDAAPPLRVVGGLASINQFTRHEEPFWTRRLPELTGGRWRAEIVPFDRAGMRSQEIPTLMQIGAVAFGTVLLSQAPPKDADLAAPDLAGLNPDLAALRRSVAAFRPHLAAALRERYGAELLAVYTHPAQVTYCKGGGNGLDGLKGRRVRTSSATQSDWVEALGGTPLVTPFAEITANLKAGHLDCAITGTMPGNTIGLDRLTTHLDTTAVSWGLSIFAASGAAWAALPDDLRAVLRRELPKLEREIWDAAERETQDGIACNLGAPGCSSGHRGAMALAPPRAGDDARRRELLARQVLPRWLQRCGPHCADIWNRTLAPVAGVAARQP